MCTLSVGVADAQNAGNAWCEWALRYGGTLRLSVCLTQRKNQATVARSVFIQAEATNGNCPFFLRHAPCVGGALHVFIAWGSYDIFQPLASTKQEKKDSRDSCFTNDPKKKDFLTFDWLISLLIPHFFRTTHKFISGQRKAGKVHFLFLTEGEFPTILMSHSFCRFVQSASLNEINICARTLPTTNAARNPAQNTKIRHTPPITLNGFAWNSSPAGDFCAVIRFAQQ